MPSAAAAAAALARCQGAPAVLKLLMLIQVIASVALQV
jgi:hypothetical protein